MGASYEYMEKYPQALESYAKELLADPDEDAVSYRMGRVLVKMKNYKKGVEMLNKALEEKERSGAYYFRGVGYEGLGKSAEAIKSYQATLRLNENHKKAIEALARLQAKAKAPTG